MTEFSYGPPTPEDEQTFNRPEFSYGAPEPMPEDHGKDEAFFQSLQKHLKEKPPQSKSEKILGQVGYGLASLYKYIDSFGNPFNPKQQEEHSGFDPAEFVASEAAEHAMEHYMHGMAGHAAAAGAGHAAAAPVAAARAAPFVPPPPLPPILPASGGRITEKRRGSSDDAWRAALRTLARQR